MKHQYTWKFLSLLTLYLWSQVCFSQCFWPATVWMSDIIAIENSNALPTAKIEKLEHVKSLYEKCKLDNDSIYARMIHRLGDLYRIIGDFEKGIRYTRKAITINAANRPASQRAYLAHSYFNLGLYYRLLNLPNESLQYLDSCITIAQQYPEKKFLAMMAFEQKALIFFITGDFQRSIEISDYGALIASQLQDTEFEALLLTQKAQAQLALNQILEAENNIQAAIQILSRPNMPSEYLAISYSIYAHVLKQKMDFDEAISYYRKAYTLNLQQENFAECIKDLSDMGFLYDKDLHDPEKALSCYTECIRLLHQAEDAYQLALVYNNVGMVYWRQKDFLEALQYFQKGLNALPIGFNDNLIQSNPTPSKLKLVTNDFIILSLLTNKGESLLELYKKEQNTKFLFYALSTFRAADKIIDQMRWKQNNEQSKLFWREKTKKTYENAIETCYLLNDYESAFFFLEKSRAVLLNDNLSELGAQKYISKVDLEKEQQLRIKISSLQQQLTSLDQSSVEYGDTRLELFATQELLEKLIKNLERSYPTYYLYKYDTTNVTITDLQSNLLSNDQSFIEYFTGDHYMYVLAISQDTAVLHKLDGKTYQTKAEELMKLCADKILLNQHYSQYSQLAHEIHDIFFKPLCISTKRIIISPDGYFMPLEVLLTDSNNPTSFLLHKHAFSYTYSASYWMENSQDQSVVDPNLLGIAPIHYQSYLQQQPLQGADLSLENVRPYFSSVNFLTGEKATKKEFLEKLPLHTIVHLYSHAEADYVGKEPRLYLNDSILNISELQLLGKLPTKLIVLSACNTATGKNMRGEGVFSLARGFAAAGIPSSITTLWQIDNQTTYQLNELFYKHLNLGLPLDEALQEAKLEFLRIHDRTYDLPYFWAATILIGPSQLFSRDKNNRITLPYAIAVTLLGFFVLSFLLLRKKERRQKNS